MMKRNIKRILSLALVLCLVLGLTINVYATGESNGGNDGISTVDDDTGSSDSSNTTTTETASVTIYQGNTATKTFTTTTTSDLATLSSVNITNSASEVIATYAIALKTSYEKYATYTAGDSVTSISNGLAAIGYTNDGTTYYLSVDVNGNLSVVTELNEYSTWTISGSNNTGYTIYNAATAYYLAFSESTSGFGQEAVTTYTGVTTSSSNYSFSWNSSGYFYKTLNSTSYRLSVSSTGATVSTSSNASVYSVTLGDSSGTYYVYTITFTASADYTGTGTTDAINGTTYTVTIKEIKTTDADLNLIYGWHIASIETFDYTTTTDETTTTSTTTVAVAAASQIMSATTNIAKSYVTSSKNTNVTVDGYDLATYYSSYDSDDSTATLSTDDLNVNVYGYNEGDENTGANGTNLTMTVSTGTTSKVIGKTTGGEEISATVGAYDSSTIYDYDYITIVPENGYYVSQITIACNGTLLAASGSPYNEFSSNITFTDELGNSSAVFGTYGVGCTSMSAGILDTASYNPTTGTSVTLDMGEWIDSHADDPGTADPYFLLIEIEKIPTPLYVEYEAGDGDGNIYADYIVDSTGSYATATNNSVAFAFDTEELEAIDYLYTVLDPTVTSYTKNGTTYYFTGWEVTYYTTASTDATNTYVGEDGNILDSRGGTASYPYLSGTVSLASGAISYGSGTTLYLFTHVKLVAQWTTVEPASVDYVVDFGLPVNLTLLDDLGSTLSDEYNWSVLAVSSHPTYGTATVNSAADGVTYTLTGVMDGTDTMSVWLAGSQNGSVLSYAVVYVNIYPATTVYYEEGFATYGTTWSVTSGGNWTTGSTGDTNQQTHVANVEGNDYNNYGYDGAYASTSAASNGTQASTSTAKDSLQFTFTGTGVDIYANCTSSTGVVLISIENSDGEEEKLLTVDTADVGSYESDDSVSYNTPIASVTGLTYGEHTVTIYVSASGTTTTEDEDGSTATTERIGFSFDGFRVYDTIDNKAVSGSSSSEEANTVQTTVYRTDSEDYPVYTEIRDVVLTGLLGTSDATEYTEDYVSSVSIGDAQVYASEDTGVAVYSTDSTYTCEKLLTLMDDGTKNELYIPSGVTLVLKLDTVALGEDDEGNTSPRTIQIGVKSTSGIGSVKLSSESNASSVPVSSVDMFYTASVKTENGVSYVTIANTGSSTISLTKLKASDDVTISDEAITEEEITALLSSTEETGAEEETAVFEPESFTVSTSVKTSGKSATVTVTAKTSTDVESVTVNGVEVTSYKTVTERTGQGRNAATTTYRQFTYTETVTASGNYTYEVCAADANGTASAAATATAAVSIRSTQTGQANQINQNKR